MEIFIVLFSTVFATARMTEANVLFRPGEHEDPPTIVRRLPSSVTSSDDDYFNISSSDDGTELAIYPTLSPLFAQMNLSSVSLSAPPKPWRPTGGPKDPYNWQDEKLHITAYRYGEPYTPWKYFQSALWTCLVGFFHKALFQGVDRYAAMPRTKTYCHFPRMPDTAHSETSYPVLHLQTFQKQTNIRYFALLYVLNAVKDFIDLWEEVGFVPNFRLNVNGYREGAYEVYFTQWNVNSVESKEGNWTIGGYQGQESGQAGIAVS